MNLEEPSFLISNIRLTFTKLYKTQYKELLAIVEAFKIWRAISIKYLSLLNH